jgi:hypothetical protein
VVNLLTKNEGDRVLNPPKQFENMKKYEHIIHLAQDTKAVLPPNDFTEKVMENLPAGQYAAGSKLLRLFLLPFQNLNFRVWSKKSLNSLDQATYGPSGRFSITFSVKPSGSETAFVS